MPVLPSYRTQSIDSHSKSIERVLNTSFPRTSATGMYESVKDSGAGVFL